MNKNEKIDHIIRYVKAEVSVVYEHQGKSRDNIIKTLESLKSKPKVKVEKAYSDSVKDCYHKCLVWFPPQLYPKFPSQWFDVIDKLNRIDGVPFDKIIDVVRWTREEPFWSKNFLSLSKLRHTNKEGVKYIVVFNEKMNHEKNKQTNRSNTSNEQLAESLSKHFDNQ